MSTFVAGVHCSEKGQQTDVRDEIYEQTSVYGARRVEKRST